MTKALVVATVFAIGSGVVGLVATPRMAAADDALRCEAARLRAEARQMDCMARCERRAESRLDPDDLTDASPTEASLIFGRLSLCQESCDGKYDTAMARIGRTPMCGGDGGGTADGDLRICEAVLLRARIRKLVCDAGCFTRTRSNSDFDQGACAERCEQRYDARVTDVIAQPVCTGLEVAP